MYDWQEPKPGVAAVSEPVRFVHMGRPDCWKDIDVECLQSQEAFLPSIHFSGIQAPRVQKAFVIKT